MAEVVEPPSLHLDPKDHIVNSDPDLSNDDSNDNSNSAIHQSDPQFAGDLERSFKDSNDLEKDAQRTLKQQKGKLFTTFLNKDKF